LRVKSHMANYPPVASRAGRTLVDLHSATHAGEVGRMEDEPVHLHLCTARQDQNPAGGCFVEPAIHLTVMPFNTWQMVKRRIKERWPGLRGVPDTSIRLLYKGLEMRNNTMVADYNMDGGTSERPVELQYLIIDPGHDGDNNIGLYVDPQVPCTATLRNRVTACLGALLHGIQPRLTDDGTGATYMMREASNRHILAVFKPKDEEAFAPQNPRGFRNAENSTGLRQGVFSTQQASREVAADLLDYGKFAGVPETTLVHAKHPKFVEVEGKVVWKIGALQSFVDTIDTAGNFAPQVFSVSDVHRIGILDIRIVNLDRNDGNILVKHPRGSSRYELIPIDHGLSLPDRLEVYTDDVAWMNWPQAQKPFGEKELAYIKALHGGRDARLLAKYLGIRRECLRLLEVTTKLLQIGAEHGLTLYDIGTLLYRVDRCSDAPVQLSVLERLIENSVDAAVASAGDGHVAAGTGSATLSGLDLITSRRAPSQKSGSGVDRDPGLTPQLGPSSPFSSSMSTSPHGGVDIPPHLSLDGLSESDTPPSPSVVLPSAGSVKDDLANPDATPFRRQTSTSQSRRHPSGKTVSSVRLRQRTSAALIAAHGEGAGRDIQGAIFARPHLQPSDWTVEMERVFRRLITSSITEHVRKHFQRPAPSDVSTADEGTATQLVPDDAAQRVEVTSLASAFPSVLPSETDIFRNSSSVEAEEKPADAFETSTLTAPSRKMYVPPQLRARAREKSEAAASMTTMDETGSDAPLTLSVADPSFPEAVAQTAPEDPLPPSEQVANDSAVSEGAPPKEVKKKMYIPPFRRKAMEEAAITSVGSPDENNLGESQSVTQEPNSSSDVKHANNSGSCVDGGSETKPENPKNNHECTALPSSAAGGTPRYGFCVNQGPRISMEDAVDIILRMDDSAQETEFYGVYDGHGGTQAVEFVKQKLPNIIRGHSCFTDEHSMEKVLSESFDTMDQELIDNLLNTPDSSASNCETGEMPAMSRVTSIKQIAGGKGDEETFTLSSGCVVCLALVRSSQIHIANLGDCRAVVCQGGEMQALTVDHRGDVGSERERLQKLGVEVSSDGYLHGRIGISRAFGDWAWESEEKCKGLICNPDVTQTEITAETEFLLLACDGIFEHMTSKEAGQIVRRRLRATGDAKAAAEALVKSAGKNGSDNLSAIVVLFKPPPEEPGRTAPRLFGRSKQGLSCATSQLGDNMSSVLASEGASATAVT